MFEKKAISLRQCFLVFCIVFLGIAGYVQNRFGFDLAPMYQDLRSEDYIKTNCIIIAGIILYEVVYRGIYHRYSNETCIPQNETILTARDKNIFFFLAAVGFIHLYLNNFSIVNLVLRGGDGSRVVTNQTIGLLLNSRKFSFMAIALFYFISKNKNRTAGIFLLFVFFFFCLPTSEARLRILPLYLPAIAILFPFFMKKRLSFSIAIFGGTLLFFPFLSGARVSTLENEKFYADYSYSFYEVFNSLDFDSYKTFAYVVSSKTVTYGRQLIGCIFFAVPRSIWPTKPIGSGALISQTYDLGLGDFSNVSMNFLGEGYINFGLLGVFLFVVALAYMSAKFDSYFWITKKGTTNAPITIYYLSTSGFLFFLLRGDMLSGTAYYCGMIVYILFIEKVCFQRAIRSAEQVNRPLNSQITTEPSPHAR